MKLPVLLNELRLRGVALSRDGESLVVRGAKDALTAELKRWLAEHKPALMAGLREREALDEGAAEPALPQCEPDPAHAGKPFPMSDLQSGFHLADDPHMEFHVRPHYYTEQDVDGLDAERYEDAWNRMLRRHRGEIVTVRPDGLLQQVPDPAPLRIPVADLRGLPAEKARCALEATRAEMARAELPLDRWPWFDLRLSLWREAGTDRARVHFNANTFFCDGLGSTRALDEVDRLYRDPSLALPPLGIGYRDAVLALERVAASQAGAHARRYWEDRLPGLPPPPPLPVRAGVDRRCRSRLRRRERVVPPAAWEGFKAQAARLGVTPSNAVFCAYAEVLAAWSGSRHFVLSNMITRRLPVHPDIYDLMGNFVSLYPLEIDLRQGGRFIDRAAAVQARIVRDTAHRAWGGMRVMQALNRLGGGFGRAPLPFVVASGLKLGRWRRMPFSCLETPQVMLDHQFFEFADGGLLVQWDLLEEFFPEGMVDDMWDAYLALLERLGTDAEAWEQAAPFELAPHAALARREAAMAAASTWAEGPPAPGRLHDLPAVDPGLPALVAPGATVDYGTLASRARATAARLQAAGVCRGDTVAVLADRGPALLPAVHGILAAGAAYVPIDPALPAERRARLLRDSRARHVVADARHAASLPGHPVLVAEDLAADGAPPGTAVDGDAADLAYVIYTSGSTGQPKGVMIEHRGALNTVLDINQRFQVGVGDRLFGVSSFGFDLSVYDLFGAHAAGATLVYPSPDLALNPAHWLDLLQGERVTVWNSVPALAVLMAEAAERRGLRLPSLRLVLLSGDWVPLDLPDRLRRIAPSAQVVALGGATEASVWSILYPIGQVDPAWPSIPYGWPMRGQHWAVLDGQGCPAPDWVPGELHIGGAGLARGYWGDPALTAERFTAHPRTGERLYRTGDIGRHLPGGLIEFLGRADSQVKVHGHRIELGEVEAALRRCPGVADAVADVRAAAGGTPGLVAHAVPAPGAQLSGEGLREALSKVLPGYMVPGRIGFIGQVPLTPNGKVDRGALPHFDAAAPARAALVRSRPPADAAESELLRIWRRVLGRDGLGIDDDFFEAGGQSLEAVRMIGMARDAVGASLSLGALWEDRTVRKLAERCRGGARTAAYRCLQVIQGRDAGTPLFRVHPAGGQVLCYQGLAALLARPVHAFQAPGADGVAELPATIPDFAETYLAELDAAQPAGPLLLGGWSSGAFIAYEMAARLRARGREVRGVLVIDCPAPSAGGPIADDELFRWFLGDLELAPALRAALEGTVPSPGGEAAWLDATAATMREHGAALGQDPRQLRAIHRVFKRVVQASRAYRAAPADLDLLVVRAGRGEVDEFARHPHGQRVDWGWGLLARGRVHAGLVDATHHTVLRPLALPAVAALAEPWLGGERG